MRVFLFGLSPRGINLMNLSTEPVQLILSPLFIPSIGALFLFMCACTHDTVFIACSFDSDLLIHICLSLLATWHSPHHSLGSSDSPGSLCLDLRVWSLWILPVTDQSSATEMWIIGRPSEASSFEALGSRIFLLWLWAFFCTDHYCKPFSFSHLRHIGDVIFM